MVEIKIEIRNIVPIEAYRKKNLKNLNIIRFVYIVINIY